jgi:hypothetical protein
VFKSSLARSVLSNRRSCIDFHSVACCLLPYVAKASRYSEYTAVVVGPLLLLMLLPGVSKKLCPEGIANCIQL